MKLKLIVTGILSVGFMSCEKDWTCSCQNSVDDVPTYENVQTLLNTSKNTAERNCLGSEITYQSGQKYKTVCELTVKK